jgi:hypothetical protein
MLFFDVFLDAFWIRFLMFFGSLLVPFWRRFRSVGVEKQKECDVQFCLENLMFSFHFESQGWPKYHQSEFKKASEKYEKSESILGALWDHFGSQNAPKIDQKSDQKSIEKNIGKKSSRNH